MATYAKIGNIKGIQGEQGEAGPANILAVGTVTSAVDSAPASATISGASPNQTLDLVIPRGLPAPDVAPADEAMAALVGTLGTDTETAVAVKIDDAIDGPSSIVPFNYFDIRRTFANVAGFTYGNSWIAYPNYSAVQYPLRLPAKIGLTAVANKANAGYRMQDTAVNAFGTSPALTPPQTAYPWTAGTKGVVVVGDLLNNLIETDNQRNRDTALESCRALVALLSASSRIEETTATFTFNGVWSTITTDQVSAGTVKYINPNLVDGLESSQYVDIAIPAGVNYLTFWGTQGSADGTRGGTFVIREGATLLGEIATDAKAYSTTLRANGGRAPVVFKVPGTTARTIRVKAKGPAGYSGVFYALVDALLPQSATPPLIVLVKPVQTLAASHNKPALLTYLRTVPDTVAAEFGKHVIVVDPSPGWDAATMLGADLLHPNELGQEHLALAVTTGVKAELMRRLAEAAFAAGLA